MENKEQIENLKKQLENLRDICWEIDMEALAAMTEKDALTEQATPLLAGMANCDHRLQKLSLRKDSILREVAKATVVIMALEGQEAHERYIQ